MAQRMPLRNYYQILDVPYNASADEIKAAYRRLAKTYHPDITVGQDTSIQMQLINEAYEVLGDRIKKSIYNFVFFGYSGWQQAGNEEYRQTESSTDALHQEPGLTIYRPGPVRQEVSRFIVFLIRWQGFVWALLLLPALLTTLAVALNQWYLGAASMAYGLVFAATLALLVSLSQLFIWAGVKPDDE